MHCVLEIYFEEEKDRIDPPISAIKITSGDKIIGAIFSVKPKFLGKIFRWANDLSPKYTQLIIKEGEDSYTFSVKGRYEPKLLQFSERENPSARFSSVEGSWLECGGGI